MRDLGTKVFSILLMSVGVGIMLWVSSGLLGKAQSQTPADPVSNPGAAENPPPANDDLPPPADMALPPEMAAPGNAPLPTNDMPAGVPADAYPGETLQAQPEGFSYDPTGLRDPFQPFAPAQPQAPVVFTPQFVVSEEPLQNFELSQLKVVGIIWGVKKPKAMVRDPSGKLHLVYKETKMGRYGGFVAEIREGEIVVVEPTRSSDGLLTGTPRIMALTK